ncbi:MAG TPA: cytochrome c [Bacteroidetes bacterium]|nr:cytochrome c [Bacteroidota bacterium]
MKKVLTLIFGISFLFLACSGGEKSAPARQPKAQPVKKEVDGEKIYKTYCVTCHGIQGDMGASGAFNLTTSTLSLEERIEVITKGRNLMTPFEGLLSEEKIKAVAEYIETLRE